MRILKQVLVFYFVILLMIVIEGSVRETRKFVSKEYKEAKVFVSNVKEKIGGINE